MKRINLSEWEATGQGMFGQSYYHRDDKTLMLKFLTGDDAIQRAELELHKAGEAYKLGVSTPEPGELVSDGNRTGIIFHRIPGKLSIGRIIGTNPERIPEVAAQYAGLIRNLHSTPHAEAKLPSIKELYGNLIMSNAKRPLELREKACNMIQSLPDADTCLHGDLHTGNVVSDGTDFYFIDMVNFCYGYHMFDFAMNHIVLIDIPEPVRQNDYHYNSEQGKQFWDCFINAYFGKKVDNDEFMVELAPYLVARLLTFESELGGATPAGLEILINSMLEKLLPLIKGF